MRLRKMKSSAVCWRSEDASVTSSCGENSGVRWQMSTYSAQERRETTR